MTPLSPGERTLLAQTTVAARKVAEDAARRVCGYLGVELTEPPPHLREETRQLRRALRAKKRQLGSVEALIEDIAYEQWHRMLFARFLTDRQLLIEPESGVPVSLGDCAEIARETGEHDAWLVASRIASSMLPGIFRPGDPSHIVTFAPEDVQRLEGLLEGLPARVFSSDDGIGWVYQAWQEERKREVNLSEVKIGAAEIASVTQLFTEGYMVEFLLHNTLGAWWVARHGDSSTIGDLTYLRLLEDGSPVTGSFASWPASVSELRLIDPCCGSGHFLVAAFHLLLRMQLAETEGMSVADAGDAVIQNNLFGGEIDARCVQIAVFNLALAAWESGGYRPLPLPNIVCSGQRLVEDAEEWARVAGHDDHLAEALRRLASMFHAADVLGSLIDPRRAVASDELWGADLESTLDAVAAVSAVGDDPVAAVLGLEASAAARAARVLADRYHLVVTNVPYLKSASQAAPLKDYCARAYPLGKPDLATVFVERCRELCDAHGFSALVTPQNWLTLSTYHELRDHVLRVQRIGVAARLGSGAFRGITGEVVKPVLLVIENAEPPRPCPSALIDASVPGITEKARMLQSGEITWIDQHIQKRNPDSKILFAKLPDGPLLELVADSLQGIATADYARYGRCFWEITLPLPRWEFQQSTVPNTRAYGGREHVVLWEDGKAFDAVQGAVVRGRKGWGRRGVAISQMGSLPATLYTGELFDNNTAVIVPHDPSLVPALWAFASSAEFSSTVRIIDQTLKVTNATLAQVPFDEARWRGVAAADAPLPVPGSADPTQWLFDGEPSPSTAPLQVAVARLVGYCWPMQTGDGASVGHIDGDGIVCVPPVRGERPAAERLQQLLAAAFGDPSPGLVQRLLAGVGASGLTLERWLRTRFFKDHTALFHQRPFVWQIWDGESDGFSALVNYHRLDQQLLRKLAYVHVGAWIDAQRAAAARGEDGAERRLIAAEALQLKLDLILTGEQPYDIYVRWKPLTQQPLGWEPDLEDGVRLNIRPFVTADVLRARVNVNWKKDSGKDPNGSERINDRHLTLQQKRDARRADDK